MGRLTSRHPQPVVPPGQALIDQDIAEHSGRALLGRGIRSRAPEANAVVGERNSGEFRERCGARSLKVLQATHRRHRSRARPIKLASYPTSSSSTTGPWSLTRRTISLSTTLHDLTRDAQLLLTKK